MTIQKLCVTTAFALLVSCGTKTQKQETCADASCEPKPPLPITTPIEQGPSSADVNEESNKFSFAPPKTLPTEGKFWATNYYLVMLNSPVTGSNPLLDMNGNALGPKLSKEDWCNAAMEGSLRVNYPDGTSRMFNYAGVAEYDQVACGWASYPKTNRVRFRETKSPFGDGVDGMILVPFRTIAVAPTEVPFGTLVYIPQAKGQKFMLPNGEERTHDGYFFAGDTGGAMKKDSLNPDRHHHFDVFTGAEQKSPFTIVTNTPKQRNSFYIIKDTNIELILKQQHNFNPANQEQSQ